MSTVTIDYLPRPHQKRYHRAKAQFRILVWHRRAGKTVAVVNDLIRAVMRSDRPMATAAYIAPLRNQAKRIAWPFVQHYAGMIPGVSYDKAELQVNLPGGRRLFVLGSDNPDAIRGMGLVAAVFDETAQIDPYCWTQVVLPALADANGTATFIGTPKGRMNLFHELWENAEGDREWWRDELKASASGVLSDENLERFRREMKRSSAFGDMEYDQEFECSFNAAITGSYYGHEMALAESEDRITSVRYDKRLPVYVSLDLGWSDLTVAWWAQVAGNEVRILKAQAWHHTALPDVMTEIRQGWPVTQVLCPHDIKVTEFGTGTSRLEVLFSMGAPAVVVPKIGVEDGREAVRDMLPRCVFDREGCRVGIEALVQYRTDYDSVLRVYGRKHVHDWASHYADSFRYMATGLPMATPRRGARRRSYEQVI